MDGSAVGIILYAMAMVTRLRPVWLLYTYVGLGEKAKNHKWQINFVQLLLNFDESSNSGMNYAPVSRTIVQVSKIKIQLIHQDLSNERLLNMARGRMPCILSFKF